MKDMSYECSWKKVRLSVNASGGDEDVTGASGLKLCCIFHVKCIFIVVLML